MFSFRICIKLTIYWGFLLKESAVYTYAFEISLKVINLLPLRGFPLLKCNHSFVAASFQGMHTRYAILSDSDSPNQRSEEVHGPA